MILSKRSIDKIVANNRGEYNTTAGVLPVKVIQFGTGVLLRGLPDYVIDKANKQGIFNGKIVVVKSTEQGTTDSFKKQDCLYTLVIKGLKNGKLIEETTICEAIANTLSANTQWDQVLLESHNPELKLVISNTTEVGLQLVNEKITMTPPNSYPGKLLAFLYERFNFFNSDTNFGLIVIPTELLPGNGDILKDIILKLAAFNSLNSQFIEWLTSCVHFCNSLVDRIVPGKLSGPEQLAFESAHGYQDDLLITAEPYLLWAIEGNDHVRDVLSFASADPGVVISNDITVFRELKLRLLNGTHTLLCGLSVLSLFDTVKAAFANEEYKLYAAKLMSEIAESIPCKIESGQVNSFIADVIERFQNPFIEHLWLNICVQYTSKLKTRVLPLLMEHYRKSNQVPPHIAIGFAFYIVYMRSEKKDDGFYCISRGTPYKIADVYAEALYLSWKETSSHEIAGKVLMDTTIWDTDLGNLPGFVTAVQHYINIIVEAGSREMLFKALI